MSSMPTAARACDADTDVVSMNSPCKFEVVELFTTKTCASTLVILVEYLDGAGETEMSRR